MQNNKRKKALAASALLAALAVGTSGTLAYLTDNESHTNSFTVGDVKIDLEEPSWDETDKDNDGVPDAAEEIVPNEEVAKDPRVVNTGINEAVVFVRVSVPVKDVTRIADDGTILKKDGTAWDGNGVAHAPQEIFWLKDTAQAIKDHANGFDSNWVELTNEEFNKDAATVGQKVYVFGYKAPLKAGETTNTLFEKVQLKNIIENELATDQVQNIKIESLAIQSENIIGADGNVITGAELSQTQLENIYDTFIKQNATVNDDGSLTYSKRQDAEHGQTEKEADINNLYDLKGSGNVSAKINASIDDANMAPGETTSFRIAIPEISEAAKNIKITATTDAAGGKVVNLTDPNKTYATYAAMTSALGADHKLEVTPVTALEIGDATITATLTYDVPVVDKYDPATGNPIMKDQTMTVKASVHVAVEKDSRAVNGNVAANDNDARPEGTSQPLQP